VLDQLYEPHLRGAVLVAAVFDAFFTAFARRTADLFRIARNGGSSLASADVHPDLASRLVDEAAKTARHFGNMCIRALDYCPPLDVDFGDFLRALVTADADLVPDDRYGYRDALVTAFRLRGIRPKRVTSLSEESLVWQRSLDGGSIPPCAALEFGSVRRVGGLAQKAMNVRNARALVAFGKANAHALGLAPGVGPQAHSFHTVHRVGPTGERWQFVAELLQRTPASYDHSGKPEPFWFRGGCTLVFDDEGEVVYCISKPIDPKAKGSAEKRLKSQQRFYQDYGSLLSGSTFDRTPRVPFRSSGRPAARSTHWSGSVPSRAKRRSLSACGSAKHSRAKASPRGSSGRSEPRWSG